jgi:hypothetical protein
MTRLLTRGVKLDLFTPMREPAFDRACGAMAGRLMPGRDTEAERAKP